MFAISQGKARLDELIIEKRHTVEESQKGTVSNRPVLIA
jgi:hypothetical protein